MDVELMAILIDGHSGRIIVGTTKQGDGGVFESLFQIC